MFQTKFMLFTVVVLMVVGSAVAIFGGQDAARGQFPYFAYVRTYKTHKIDFILLKPWERTTYRKCGGALLSNQWILTGANCLATSTGAHVYLGLRRLFDKNEVGRQAFDVTKKDYYIHAGYDKNEPFVDDIALIKLPSPVQFSDYIKPIALSSVPTATDTDVTITGYGLVKPKIFPQNLQYANLKTVDVQECELNAHNSVAKDSIVCTRGTQSRLCWGDGGGPLVSTDSNKVVGVAIFTWGDCEDGPQGFTSVVPYLEWINGLMDGTIRKVSGGK